MSQPQAVAEVFREMDQAAKNDANAYSSLDNLTAFMDARLDAARHKYSFMRNVTGRDHGLWRMEQSRLREARELAIPIPTADQLWDAA